MKSPQSNAATRVLVGFVCVILITACAGSDKGWEAYQQGDFATALEIWAPLAEEGDAKAQYNLGILYDQGKGVARNPRRALEL